MEEGSQRLEASPEVLKDCIHDVKFYLMDGLPEPPCEVPYGLFFMFKIVYKELIFIFWRTEHRCCEMNTPQSSLNVFIELCGSL